MTDLALARRSPWSGVWQGGRFGASSPEPGLVVREPAPAAMALLTARKGHDAALLVAAQTRGLELPTAPRFVQSGRVLVLWAGPSQWLVRGPGSYADLISDLADLAVHATFIDQSHGRAVLSLSGVRARDVLAKGFDIDLHPRAFGPGDLALTQAAGMSAYLWQVDEAPTYEIAVPSSFAGSFWHWLSGAAAEYGYTVEHDLSAGPVAVS